MTTTRTYTNGKLTSEHHILLRRAIISRERKTILRILKLNSDWKTTYKNGDTALHLVMHEACNFHNQLDIISTLQIFLHRGLNPNVKNHEGTTVLHLAIKHRLDHVVEFLIKSGADLNICDDDGNSIAHFVVIEEFHRFCKVCYVCDQPRERKTQGLLGKYFIDWLIQNGLNVNSRNNARMTPLDLAVKVNLQHVIPTLLEYTHDVNIIDETDRNILHVFLESLVALNNGSSRNLTKATSIPTFCYDESYVLQIIKMLLEKGVSVDAVDKNGNTPLHLAAKQRRSKIIDLMLESFTCVNACDDQENTVLHIIIDTCIDNSCSKHNTKYVKFVDILLSKGANIHLKNKDGLLPVQLAALRRNLSVLQMLANRGADLSVMHDRGSLLHFCTESKLGMLDGSMSQEVIDYLVGKMQINVNTKNIYGMAPLHLALQAGDSASVEKLVGHGANVHSRELSQYRYTPLHLAVINNQEHCIEVLVKAGAAVNAKDALGRTPLHLAARHGGCLANLLLRLGAHVDLQDSEGYLPLHLAVRHENFEGVKELLKFGAFINDTGTLRELENLPFPDNMINCLLRQWFKLKTIGLPAIDDYMLYIDKCETFEYQKRCVEEVEILKTHYVVKNLSLYDILHMDLNNQCAFIKDMEDLLDPFILQDQYPEYSDVIFAACHQAVARQPLIWPAINAWYCLTDIYLPEFCVERIIAYLENVDLRIMIEATRESSMRRSISRSYKSLTY